MDNNLFAFIRSCFVPAQRAVEATPSDGPRHIVRYSRAAMLESFWWLYLGAELGIFSEEGTAIFWEDVNKLYDASFESLLNQRSVFSDRLWFALQRALRVRKALFDYADDMSFKAPRALASTFQTTLMEENRFAKDGSVQDLSISLAFFNEQEWRGIMRREVSLSTISSNLSDRVGNSSEQTKESIYAGFFRALEHMNIYRHIFSYLRRNEKIAETDAYLLERRIKEITNWRLNFGIGDARARFLEIATDVARKMASDVRVQNVALEQPPMTDAFIKQVEDVIESWSHTRPMVHGARG
jgi:hypothetical protein